MVHKSVPQCAFPLIAGSKVSVAQVEAIQKALPAMPGNEADQKVLTTIGVKEFDTGSEKRLRDLLGWLGPEAPARTP